MGDKIIDVTTNYIRVRKKNPKRFVSFRTIDIGSPGYSKFVIGFDRFGDTATQAMLISIAGLKERRRQDWKLFYANVPEEKRAWALRKAGVW